MKPIALLVVSVLAACKGETKIQDNPQTKADLDTCTAALADKTAMNTKLLDENATLLKGNTQNAPSELNVVITGDVLTVKPGAAGGTPAFTPSPASIALTNTFIDIVRKSRGSFQKCYEGVLRKRGDMQSHTQQITVTASFEKQGVYKNAVFQPSIDATFDNCVHAIATHWALPATSPAVTLQAPIELKPS
jgi:hypothetical protein